MDKKYCFHHVPKTAGSSLQVRICHREWIGELPAGSTLVVTPLADTTTLYRVNEDTAFNPNEPIVKAFRRRLGLQKPGKSNIVMGHLTTVNQEGDHYTWLRHPLERDISHWRYDVKNEQALSNNLEEHLKLIGPNFYMAWFWQNYMGKRGGAESLDHAVELVEQQLKKFKRIYKHEDFENSWDEICNILNISQEPRFNSNISKENNITHVSDEFKKYHKEKNQLDYYLYEKFMDYAR